LKGNISLNVNDDLKVRGDVIPREGVESKRRLVGLLDVEQVIPREGVERPPTPKPH
jgi:hypothetical protein